MRASARVDSVAAMTQTFDQTHARARHRSGADEATTLRGFLDYHRDTFRWKCAGLTQQQLAQSLPPSDMTLGGMMKHLALVEVRAGSRTRSPATAYGALRHRRLGRRP